MIIRLHKFVVTHAGVINMPSMVAGGCDNIRLHDCLWLRHFREIAEGSPLTFLAVFH